MLDLLLLILGNTPAALALALAFCVVCLLLLSVVFAFASRHWNVSLRFTLRPLGLQTVLRDADAIWLMLAVVRLSDAARGVSAVLEGEAKPQQWTDLLIGHLVAVLSCADPNRTYQVMIMQAAATARVLLPVAWANAPSDYHPGEVPMDGTLPGEVFQMLRPRYEPDLAKCELKFPNGRRHPVKSAMAVPLSLSEGSDEKGWGVLAVIASEVESLTENQQKVVERFALTAELGPALGQWCAE